MARFENRARERACFFFFGGGGWKRRDISHGYFARERRRKYCAVEASSVSQPPSLSPHSFLQYLMLPPFESASHLLNALLPPSSPPKSPEQQMHLTACKYILLTCNLSVAEVAAATLSSPVSSLSHLLLTGSLRHVSHPLQHAKGGGESVCHRGGTNIAFQAHIALIARRSQMTTTKQGAASVAELIPPAPAEGFLVKEA